MLTEYLIKYPAYGPLGFCKSLPLCVSRVAHKGKYSLFPYLAKSLQIYRIPVYRCIVHLKVTGMYDNARGTVNRQRCSVCYRVIRLNELYAELPQVDGLSVRDDFSFDRVLYAMLFEFFVDKRHCKLRGIDWNIYFLQHIRQSTNVVLMTMCYDKSFTLLIFSSR